MKYSKFLIEIQNITAKVLDLKTSEQPASNWEVNPPKLIQPMTRGLSVFNLILGQNVASVEYEDKVLDVKIQVKVIEHIKNNEIPESKLYINIESTSGKYSSFSVLEYEANIKKIRIFLIPLLPEVNW